MPRMARDQTGSDRGDQGLANDGFAGVLARHSRRPRLSRTAPGPGLGRPPDPLRYRLGVGIGESSDAVEPALARSSVLQETEYRRIPMSTDLTTRIAQDHLDAMFAAAAASRRVKE